MLLAGGKSSGPRLSSSCCWGHLERLVKVQVPGLPQTSQSRPRDTQAHVAALRGVGAWCRSHPPSQAPPASSSFPPVLLLPSPLPRSHSPSLSPFPPSSSLPGTGRQADADCGSEERTPGGLAGQQQANRTSAASARAAHTAQRRLPQQRPEWKSITRLFQTPLSLWEGTLQVSFTCPECVRSC